MYIWVENLKMNVLYYETGTKEIKALWDSGAGQCVLSFDCYNAIPAMYKSDLFPSLVRIRPANGTIIENKGVCDITFRIGQTKSPFHFCAQIVCHNSLYLGIISPEHFTLGPLGS